MNICLFELNQTCDQSVAPSIEYLNTNKIREAEKKYVILTGLYLPRYFVSVSTTDEKKVSSNTPTDSGKLAIKRARPKPTSPNRQGPQQCQV